MYDLRCTNLVMHPAISIQTSCFSKILKIFRSNVLLIKQLMCKVMWHLKYCEWIHIHLEEIMKLVSNFFMVCKKHTSLSVCLYSNDPFLLPVWLLYFLDHEHMLQGRSECWSLLPGYIPFMYIFFCLVLPNKNSNKMTVNSVVDLTGLLV